MLKYQKLTVMQDKSKNKIVVENESNTFEFFDCSMNEVAAFIRTVLDEED